MRSSGAGYSRVNTRVVGSGASIDFTALQMYPAPWPSALVRSMASLAAVASMARPVWNWTPSRSVKVQVRPSSLTDHAEASAGFTVPVAES